MHTRSTGWLAGLLVLAAASAATAATAPPAAESAVPLTTDQLMYEGASVEMQVDVNGEAAMQLLGGLLDAVAEIAHEQGAAMAAMAFTSTRQAVPADKAEHSVGSVAQGSPVLLIEKMAQPLIDPAKEAIKSVTRVSVLVMKPGESVNAEEAMTYYHGLMTSRGWIPMVTIRAEDDARILVLLAPGAKGVFAAVLPTGDEMVVAMVATTKPLGDLVAEIVRAAGGQALLGMLTTRVAYSEERHAAEQEAEHAHAAAPAPAPEPAPEG